MLKKIFFTIMLILLAIFQVSFFSQFNFFQTSLNIILVTVILITLIREYRVALIAAIILGLTLDLYSVYGFGIITLALLLPVIICNNLLQKFFARRSILSLIFLMLISTLTYNLIILIFTSLSYWLNWNNIYVIFDFNYLIILLKQSVFNTTALIFLFTIIQYFNKKIRSKFLISENINP